MTPSTAIKSLFSRRALNVFQKKIIKLTQRLDHRIATATQVRFICQPFNCTQKLEII